MKPIPRKTPEHAVHHLEVAADTLEHALREVFNAPRQSDIPHKTDTALEHYEDIVKSFTAWKRILATGGVPAPNRHKVGNMLNLLTYITDRLIVRIREQGITDLQSDNQGARLLVEVEKQYLLKFKHSSEFPSDAEREHAITELSVFMEGLATLLGIKQQYLREKQNSIPLEGRAP